MEGISIIIAGIALLLAIASLRKEKYANQVVHAGVGGIAGPMGRYDGKIPYRWAY